jgi:uncharacterized protein
MALEQEILSLSHVIAVIGLSANPERNSHRVASYLQEHGYHIIPVNPGETEILGEVCYPDLLSVPNKIDVVVIFRRAEDVPPIVRQAITIGAGAVWMQPGIINEEAAALAREAGLKVVMDRCAMREHGKLRAGGDARP